MREIYASDFFNGERTIVGETSQPEQPVAEQFVAEQPQQIWICKDLDDPDYGCGGTMCYPLEWSEDGPRHWNILLRCPDCESCREGRFNQDQVMALDDELDRATSSLLGDRRRMEHHNMSQEADFFKRALDAELIVADDFAH